jgi:hypothetical protein
VSTHIHVTFLTIRIYENCVIPLPERARKPRPRTRGIMLDKISKSLGGLRMCIFVAEGNRRPHDLVQAAKFASKASVVVRHEVPILMHWKQYKGQRPGAIYCTRFVDRLNVCMGIPS